MIVVDSAAVADALTAIAGTYSLRARLRDEELHAPELLDFEIVSVIRGQTLGGYLSPARAMDALCGDNMCTLANVSRGPSENSRTLYRRRFPIGCIR